MSTIQEASGRMSSVPRTNRKRRNVENAYMDKSHREIVQNIQKSLIEMPLPVENILPLKHKEDVLYGPPPVISIEDQKNQYLTTETEPD